MSAELALLTQIKKRTGGGAELGEVISVADLNFFKNTVGWFPPNTLVDSINLSIESKKFLNQQFRVSPTPTAFTTSNINDIAAAGGLFVAVGDVGKIIKAEGDGDWSDLIANPLGTATLKAVAIDGDTVVVGGSGGALAISVDRAATWAQLTLPNSTQDVTMVAVKGSNILAAASSVMYISINSGVSFSGDLPFASSTAIGSYFGRGDDLIQTRGSGDAISSGDGGVTAIPLGVNYNSIPGAGTSDNFALCSVLHGESCIICGDTGLLTYANIYDQGWRGYKDVIFNGIEDVLGVCVDEDTQEVFCIGSWGGIAKSTINNLDAWEYLQYLPFRGYSYEYKGIAASGKRIVIVGESGLLYERRSNDPESLQTPVVDQRSGIKAIKVY